MPIRVREYGEPGPPIHVLHGGPGAPGYMAPVARELSAEHFVLEPLQRGGSAEPLSVARHVNDEREVLARYASHGPAILLGSSWGAMLALCVAAERPPGLAALILVGCGTFDQASRAEYERRRDALMRPDFEAKLLTARTIEDPEARLTEVAEIYDELYAYERLPESRSSEQDDGLPCDPKAHTETWTDMLRLQEEGKYPAAFSKIACPMLLIHGDTDPHPGPAIRDSLLPHLPQLQYEELERCGHYPWNERYARENFFQVIRMFLSDPQRGHN